MRALTWNGRKSVAVQDHPDPRLLEPTDAVIDVTATSIGGSDLHTFHGLVPGMTRGDVLGHEFVGVVSEVGEDVPGLAVGDRVVVPSPVACGRCASCAAGLFAACDRTNGGRGAARFGHPRRAGGLPGGQAERVRVPHADVGPEKIPDGVTDEQAVLLADALPTGYQAVALAGVDAERSVAVFGAGAVGLMAALSAKRLLASPQVIVVDRVPERLAMARRLGADAVIDFDEEADPVARVRELTDGRGVDVAVDAAGLEAASPLGIASVVERTAGALQLQSGSLTALRWAVDATRWGGALSVAGFYAHAQAQMFPFGPLWEKGLRVGTGHTNVHAHLPALLEAVADNTVDPSVIVTDRAPLEDAPNMYRRFADEKGACIKVVLEPAA